MSELGYEFDYTQLSKEHLLASRNLVEPDLTRHLDDAQVFAAWLDYKVKRGTSLAHISITSPAAPVDVARLMLEFSLRLDSGALKVEPWSDSV